ncbi:MAG: CueP family metal-binding protein [Paenibacillaceae bacterium]
MRRKIIAVTGLIAVILGAYLFAVSVDKDAPKDNEALSMKQLVHDYSVGNIKAQSASITSRQLIVTNSDESQITYDLLEDDFFVSLAPYVENTHPCADHNLTSYRGEMADEDFIVYIEDMQGNVIMDQTLKSQSNGFIDLWLPRDNTYRVTIENEGRAQESEISTFENDNTCITTMQLTENKSV